MKILRIIKIVLATFIVVYFSYIFVFKHTKFNNKKNNERTKINSKSNVFKGSKLRTFIHSKEQVQLTKFVNIMPKQCSNSQPISVFIHSAANYHERRRIQRETWVSDEKKRNISVYFAVGMTQNKSDEQIIRKESEKYGDIIQFGFIDFYYNNTLKAISILRWIQKYCKQSKLILKTDDDVLVNTEVFLRNLNKFKTGFHGLIYPNVKPNRDPNGKWYMPKKFYPQKYYPKYTPGGAYLMTADIIDRLVAGIDSYSGYITDVDDWFIAGVLAQRAGIKRFLTGLIGCCSCYKCDLFKFGAVYSCHLYNHKSLEQIWRGWKHASKQACFPQRLKKTKTLNETLRKLIM